MTTGADIVATLLRADDAVITLVPAPQMKLGRLPENAPLNALLIRTVSIIDRQVLKRQAIVRSTARVSVTVRAGNYRDQGAVIRAARDCCAGWTGDMAPAQRISILNAGVGPDVNGPGNSFEQTIDFRVSFDAPY